MIGDCVFDARENRSALKAATFFFAQIWQRGQICKESLWVAVLPSRAASVPEFGPLSCFFSEPWWMRRSSANQQGPKRERGRGRRCFCGDAGGVAGLDGSNRSVRRNSQKRASSLRNLVVRTVASSFSMGDILVEFDGDILAC